MSYQDVTATRFLHGFGEVTGNVSLAIEFGSPAAMVEWLDAVKSIGDLPMTATAYVKDSLDSGVPAKNDFLLKNEGDRPEEFRLQIETLNVGGV